MARAKPEPIPHSKGAYPSNMDPILMENEETQCHSSFLPNFRRPSYLDAHATTLVARLIHVGKTMTGLVPDEMVASVQVIIALPARVSHSMFMRLGEV